MTDDDGSVDDWAVMEAAGNAADAALYGPMPAWIVDPVEVYNGPDGRRREVTLVEFDAPLHVTVTALEDVDDTGRSTWTVSAGVDTASVGGLSADDLRTLRADIERAIDVLEAVEAVEARRRGE